MFAKKNKILIPENISIIYCEKKQMLICLGSKKQTAIKLLLKLYVENNNIIVSSIPFSTAPYLKKKIIKEMQGTTSSLIKQMISEASDEFCINLKFVGVGYRAIPVDGFNNQLILLKLGYSHNIYFRIPDNNFKMACFKKFTNLFIAGPFYQSVNQISSLIRICRAPEPYKGKGILYSNEKINLKQGKRI